MVWSNSDIYGPRPTSGRYEPQPASGRYEPQPASGRYEHSTTIVLAPRRAIACIIDTVARKVSPVGAYGEVLELRSVAPGQPKYRLLRDALVALIRDLPPGSGVPTERELSERFRVSRGTVRQALDRLEAEQRIYRHQGKGTFVARQKIDQVLELTSHTDYVRARGMEPTSRLIGVVRTPAQADVAAMLALAEGDEILQIERVRLADEEPLAVEMVCLDARRFDGIAAVLGESQSLYELLRARYGVELAWAEETIEAVAAPEREAGLLGIASGAPVLLLCRQSFDPIGRPVELVRSVYRADRFRFHTRLEPSAASAAPLPPGTRLRLATVADCPGAARVFVSAWRAGYAGIVEQAVLDALDEEDIADWLGTLTHSNGPTTWVAESADGEILAFSRHGEDPLDSRRGHIYSLYVAAAATGRGIAKALLDHDLQVLSERGLDTVTLWVFEQNQAARGLYASFGFVPDGARRVEPQYGAQEIRMRRTVANRPPGSAP
jgi:GntR family transcriptional regulator